MKVFRLAIALGVLVIEGIWILKKKDINRFLLKHIQQIIEILLK